MKVVKVLGYAATSLVAIVALAAASVYFTSNAKLDQRFSVTPRDVVIPTDAASIAHGEHLAHTRGCIDCHGQDFGGGKVIEDGAMGRLYGPNLTRGRGSAVANFTNADWVRAIRHGVTPDGHGLFVMPSDEYSHFSDADLGSVIAYLKSVSPVDRERPETQYGPVTRVLLTIGKMKLAATQIDHAHLQPAFVQKAATVAYGRYLANGCVGCHNPNFSGGKIDIGPPDWPAARNLTPAGDLAHWSEVDFVRAIREAKLPDGTTLNPVMPRGFAGLDDVELSALFKFLKTLPPVPTGVKEKVAAVAAAD
jgi:mono/diheme cytochrome c family protein